MAEQLTFKVGLSGTYWGKKPRYAMFIKSAGEETLRDTVVVKHINAESGVTAPVELIANLEEGNYELHIRFINKEDDDTLLKDGVVVKDMLLNIDSIKVEDIDLGTLRHSESVYKLDKPRWYNGKTITELKNCVNLGWNGTYILPFSVPLHYWLLKNSN